MRRMFTIAVAAAVAAAVFGVWRPRPAFAHRSGCHAAHTCPSDSGCYYVGQPYYGTCDSSGGSYSGGGTSSSSSSSSTYSPPPTEPPTTLPPPPDLTAPNAPQLGTPIVTGHSVRLGVTAERGSTISLDSDGVNVLSVRATGAGQTLTFDVADGTHRLTLIATDPAGNASVESDTTVTVDTTPPAPPTITASPGTAASPSSVIKLAGEPGATYQLHIPGTDDKTGIFSASPATFDLLLPAGTYHATATATDPAGNNSGAGATDFTVAIDPPAAPMVRVMSKPGAKTIVVGVTGPVKGKAIVTLDGERPQESILDTYGGEAKTTFEAADGSYQLHVKVRDFQGRESPDVTSRVVVDTRPPAIEIEASEKLASRGSLGFIVTADAGAKVAVHAAGKTWSWTSNGSTVRKTVDLRAGKYVVKATATDEFDNTTVKTVAATVSPTFGEVAGGLAVMAVIVCLLWWQRRRLWRVAKTTAASAANLVSELIRRRRFAAFEQQRSAERTRHEAALSAYAEDRQAWQGRRSTLEDRITSAASYSGRPAEESRLPGKWRRGERIFYTVANCELIEPRSHQGIELPTVIDRGSLVITSQRVFFTGASTNKEWLYAKLVWHRATSNETTIGVTNRKRDAGFRYASSHGDDVAYYLGLAISRFRDDASRFTAALEGELRSHLTCEPTPPEQPEILDAVNPYAPGETKRPVGPVRAEQREGSGSGADACWARDPSGRYAFRWWDGTSWTSHVVDADGVMTDAPLDAAGAAEARA